MIRHAIVPVAGHGTRMLPATKSQPKEMLPVARKPIVQYVAEELVANEISEILFITGRNKSSIENHFDRDPELIRVLNSNDKAGLLRDLENCDLAASIYYTRQSEQKGLGHAILCGESFAGEQPFAVALGDSIIGMNGASNALRHMAELFESQRASCVLAVEEVPLEEVSQYGVVDPAEGKGDVFRVRGMIEKPTPEQAPSRLAIAARYIFSPVIFDMLRRVEADRRGEIQLTDAIQMLCEEGRRVLAFRLPAEERRYDIGNFPSYFETFVEFALADPAYGPGFRTFLENLLKK
ncbi:MAG: UTP--glucose-1-phosphate uridylyltransferase [Bryobacterales bacterium]|nr:UTP--glucose-1-phosphate uridylyltransferase [Bryobacterales bacterium]